MVRRFRRGGEVLQEGQQGSEGLSRGMGVSGGGGRPFWRARWDREAILEGQKNSGGSADGGRPTRRWTGEIGKPSQWVGKGPEALLEGRKASRGPLGGPRGVGSGRKAHPEGCE